MANRVRISTIGARPLRIDPGTGQAAVDRMIARQFECNFIHLHSTSMIMLDAFLEIDELRGFEINIESFNIPVAEMIPYYRMVQDAGRPLLIRGSLTLDEARLIAVYGDRR